MCNPVVTDLSRVVPILSKIFKGIQPECDRPTKQFRAVLNNPALLLSMIDGYRI